MRLYKNNREGEPSEWVKRPDKDSWELVEQFYPKYYSSELVALSDTYSRLINNEITLDEFWDKYPMYERLSWDELCTMCEDNDTHLMKQAYIYYRHEVYHELIVEKDSNKIKNLWLQLKFKLREFRKYFFIQCEFCGSYMEGESIRDELFLLHFDQYKCPLCGKVQKLNTPTE